MRIAYSVDLLDCDFLRQYELPQILARTKSQGALLLRLDVKPCNIDGTGLETLKAVNTFGKTLADLAPSDRARVYIEVATLVRHQLRL